GEQHAWQGVHEHHEQAGEGAEHALGADPQFPKYLEERPDDGGHDNDQQDHLEDRPFGPRYRSELGDLVDRPSPDQFHEAEDCRDGLLQKMQNLAENLMHGRFSRCVCKPAAIQKLDPGGLRRTPVPDRMIINAVGAARFPSQMRSRGAARLMAIEMNTVLIIAPRPAEEMSLCGRPLRLRPSTST